MRKVAINFVGSARIRRAGIILSTMISLIMILAVASEWVVRRHVDERRQMVIMMNGEIDGLLRGKNDEGGRMGLGNNAPIRQALALNANAALLAVERSRESGARLIKLNISGPSGAVDVVYQVDSFEVAVRLDEALNDGIQARPWKLHRIAISGDTAMGAGNFSAYWSAQVDKL